MSSAAARAGVSPALGAAVSSPACRADACSVGEARANEVTRAWSRRSRAGSRSWGKRQWRVRRVGEGARGLGEWEDKVRREVRNWSGDGSMGCSMWGWRKGVLGKWGEEGFCLAFWR